MKNCRLYRAEETQELLLKTVVYLEDKPGQLHAFASLLAEKGANITYFYYNRSENPNRVLLEATGPDKEGFKEICQVLEKEGLLDPPSSESALELSVLSPENVLKIQAHLPHRPGELARLAGLCRDYRANVIYMTYDENLSPTTVTVALATSAPQEVDDLLKALNRVGYCYSCVYEGASQSEVDEIIGLNLAERFFLRLKKLLVTEDLEQLRKVVLSSQRLCTSLTRFSQQAGRNLAAGQVFTNILAFAASARAYTGDRFSYRRLPPLPLGQVLFHLFRLPVGGNICLLEAPEEIVMIDGSYGIYYEDVKRMLRESDLEPERITRIYLSHADADHAGLSGYFAREFGTRVYLHPEARGVLEHENRAWGTNSPLLELNHYYTVLVNSFTGFAVPQNWEPLRAARRGELGGFLVIDDFTVGDLTFLVLESKGGHVRDQVFFASPEAGIIFTADYLLWVDSLRLEEKEFLNLPRFMMTSTNAVSSLFRQEMEELKDLVLALDEKLAAKKRGMIVVPGHGDYYPARLLHPAWK